MQNLNQKFKIREGKRNIATYESFASNDYHIYEAQPDDEWIKWALNSSRKHTLNSLNK